MLQGVRYVDSCFNALHAFSDSFSGGQLTVSDAITGQFGSWLHYGRVPSFPADACFLTAAKPQTSSLKR